VPLSS
jgi:hypothetical protein